MPTSDGDPHPKYRRHSCSHRNFRFELLRLIDIHPTWTQRQLAKALSVSLDKINYYMRPLKEKGLVRWGNFTQNPNKLGYLHILTPEGLAHKLRLTAYFLERKEAEVDRIILSRAIVSILRRVSLSTVGQSWAMGAVKGVEFSKAQDRYSWERALAGLNSIRYRNL